MQVGDLVKHVGSKDLALVLKMISRSPHNKKLDLFWVGLLGGRRAQWLRKHCEVINASR